MDDAPRQQATRALGLAISLAERSLDHCGFLVPVLILLLAVGAMLAPMWLMWLSQRRRMGIHFTVGLTMDCSPALECRPLPFQQFSQARAQVWAFGMSTLCFDIFPEPLCILVCKRMLSRPAACLTKTRSASQATSSQSQSQGQIPRRQRADPKAAVSFSFLDLRMDVSRKISFQTKYQPARHSDQQLKFLGFTPEVYTWQRCSRGPGQEPALGKGVAWTKLGRILTKPTSDGFGAFALIRDPEVLQGRASGHLATFHAGQKLLHFVILFICSFYDGSEFNWQGTGTYQHGSPCVFRAAIAERRAPPVSTKKRRQHICSQLGMLNLHLECLNLRPRWSAYFCSKPF